MGWIGRILREHCPEIYTLCRIWLLRKYIKRGDIVVQAGVDMTTDSSDVIYMSKIVGEGGLVVGIEPDRNSVQKINDYIKQHEIMNIVIVGKAVWKTRGKLSLLVGKRSMDNRLEDIGGVYDAKEIEAYIGTCMVETDTLDNILDDLGVENVSHIRLTVNGAELEVLEGMTKTLTKRCDGGLSMVIAGGKTQPYGPFIDNEPPDHRILSILRRYGFGTKHDKKGWIIAWK